MQGAGFPRQTEVVSGYFPFLPDFIDTSRIQDGLLVQLSPVGPTQITRAGSVGSTFSRSPSGPRRTVADTGLGTFFQHPFGMYMCLKRETGRDACSPFHVDAQNILTCLHTHDATFPPTEPLPHTGYNGKTWRKSGTGVEASPSAVHSMKPSSHQQGVHWPLGGPHADDGCE